MEIISANLERLYAAATDHNTFGWPKRSQTEGGQGRLVNFPTPSQ